MGDSRNILGKRIKELRQKANLTQENLAESAGLSLKHLGEIERGRGNPTLLSLENVAKALDVSLCEMFDYGHEYFSIEEIRAEIEKILDNATDEDCRTIYRLLKTWSR